MINKYQLETFKDFLMHGKTAEAFKLLDQWPVESLRQGKFPKDLHPLYWALLYQRWQLVERLLECQINTENVELYNSYSPLSWACIYGKSNVIKILLNQIRDPNLFDQQQKTPLHWAAEYTDLDTVKQLVQAGANVNAHHGHVPTPIFMAIWRGKKEIVEFLLAAGAHLNARDTSMNTVFHATVYSMNLDIIDLLLQHSSKIDTQNHYGQSPLHLASICGYTEIVKKLLASGAQGNLKDKQGKTAIVLAAISGHLGVFDALINHKVSFYNKDQKEAMAAAILGNHAGMVKRLLQWFDLSAPLSKDHPLITAIMAQQYALVKLLFSSGADPNAEYEGQFLLQFAQKRANPQLVKIMIQAGAQSGREAVIHWLDQVLYLRKSGKVILEAGSSQLSGDLLIALQKNLESLGYVLSAELAERVLSLNLEQLREFYQLLIPSLQVMVGANKIYQPMYPNFPEQVKQMSHVELYLNALRHYWGDVIGERILPNYQKLPRPPLEDTLQLKVIHLGSNEDLMQLFVKFLQAKSALRPEDKDDLVWFVSTRQDRILDYLPTEIPQRENAAILTAALHKYTSLKEISVQYLKTAVDVLRFATAYSDGDVSLAANTRFVSFSKKLRRWILERMETIPNLNEDLWRHPEKFKRLAERLHPGDFQTSFPNTWLAFQNLRRGLKPNTFRRQIEMGLANHKLESILPLLQSRPGEFARRLDHVLRISKDPQGVMDSFKNCADRLPSPLLLQVLTHFAMRPTPHDLRVFFPKGELAKLQAIDYNLPTIDTEICQKIELICQHALVSQFAQRPALGKSYLDPELKHYSVPFAMRSASKTLKTIGRGSRIALPEATTIRFFIWWKDGRERTDIDLSAFALSDQFEPQTTIAYYNLKDLGGYHSGDITSAPNGASEFIDIELEPFLSRNTRYVMMVVNSFTTQAYCDLPECFAGVMARQRPNSGEIYDPRTVLNKFDLTANTTIAIPLILDLYEHKMIWTDLSLKRNPSESNNVHSNRSSLSLLCQAMTQLRKPNLYQLFELHIQSRGQKVEHMTDAQTIFALNQGITPFDIPTILSEYL